MSESKIPKELTVYEKLSAKLDSKALRFTIFTTIAILIGGLVEIPPFFMMGQVQPTDQQKPYSALELAGRNVYQQEGCFYCHTQLIRPFKWETDRWDKARQYGPEPYSKAGEFAYDHPFLWGSKRTGPDLSHESTIRPSAAWHYDHLRNPRAAVSQSIMPAYPWLEKTPIDVAETLASMRALSVVGVPYSDAQISAAESELAGKTQADALVAYLLKLGRDSVAPQAASR
ncbi:MAG: cbb3-type cytochrome c oxidase subunit II [Leptospirales bacterium]|nr:cbb3-type cytochrome c oxidase subunit II [Leptospirales bacterium]